MSGYTPLFDSALDGTLFGKWPHTGIWTCLLSQMDKRGVIDKHPNLLAAKIGVPVDLLLSCISDFMQPDPGSRTPDYEGRRMELLEPGKRDWGWRVLNHQLYREKARKSAYDSNRTESGKDRERKAEQRAASRDVPTCPDAFRDVPLSDTNSDTEANKNPPKPPTGGVFGLDAVAWNRWETYRRSIRKPIKPASLEAAQRKLASFGSQQAAVVENSIAEGYQGLIPPKTNGYQRPAEPPRRHKKFGES